MSQILVLISLLVVVSIIILVLVLIPISFYYVYLVNKYLYINKWTSNKVDSDKTLSLFEKAQNIISFILYYSIGGGYNESLKLFDDLFFVDSTDNKDDLFKSFKSTIRKLTSIMYKVLVVIIILILLFIGLAMIS